MAYLVTVYTVMDCILMADTVMAYTVMAYIVTAYIVKAYIVMAYVLMADLRQHEHARLDAILQDRFLVRPQLYEVANLAQLWPV